MAIIRSISNDKKIKLCCADITASADEICAVHGLSGYAKRFFCEVAINAVLLSADMKEENATFSTVLRASEPFNNTVVVCSANDKIKGYTSCEIDREYNFADEVRENAALMIICDHGLKSTYSSQVPLNSDSLCACVEDYLEISQQHRGIVKSSTSCGCIGIMIQPVLNSEWEAVEERMAELDEMSAELLSGRCEAKSILFQHGFDVLLENELSFECDCSVEKMEEVIISLGKKEALDTVLEVGMIEITCPYCRSKYCFGKDEVENMFGD